MTKEEFVDFLRVALPDDKISVSSGSVSGSVEYKGETLRINGFVMLAAHASHAVEKINRIKQKAESHLKASTYSWQIQIGFVRESEKSYSAPFEVSITMFAEGELGVLVVNGEDSMSVMNASPRGSNTYNRTFEFNHERPLHASVSASARELVSNTEEMSPQALYVQAMNEKVPNLCIYPLDTSKIPSIDIYKAGTLNPRDVQTIFPKLRTLTATTVDGLVNATIKILAVQYAALTEQQQASADYVVQHGRIYQVSRDGVDALEMMAVVEVVHPERQMIEQAPDNLGEAEALQRAQEEISYDVSLTVGSGSWHPTKDDIEHLKAKFRQAVIDVSEGKHVPHVEAVKKQASVEYPGREPVEEVNCLDDVKFEDDGDQVTIDKPVTNRRVLHITAGDDNWTPTDDELRKICDLFMEANVDDKDLLVTTRNSIEVAGALKASIIMLKSDEHVEAVAATVHD